MSTRTRFLADELDARQHYLRAAHVEQHQGQNTADYIPTARALEVIHRITRSMTTQDVGRAWSLTGPYGAGKSSFSLFLHALLGPADDTAPRSAATVLRSSEPELADELDMAREALRATSAGFIRAVATAQREPVITTVLRALQTGAHDYWPHRRPRAVTQALSYAATTRTPRAVADAVGTLASHAPLILIIDEFGKNLENFAAAPGAADLFVLQELAERCSGAHATPAFILTLQHLAFDDYVRTSGQVQRGEWSKIQGRFEDIPFIDSAEQSARLVAAAFTSAAASPAFERARRSWVKTHAKTCEELGLLRLIPGGAQALSDCYPLHPLTLLTLPDLCARFGQHGRTLFSFLTGREPYSVVTFLQATPSSSKLPSVGVDQLFDFFINSGGGTNPQRNARLAEINAAIREATGLTGAETMVLKVIGVLNLLSQGGPLRASRAIVSYAAGLRTSAETDAVLDALQRRGLLIFRGYADEYRLWRGSDLDLPAIVAQAREQVAALSPAALLARDHTMPPAIAGRHSQDVGMLRYFQTTFADETSPELNRPGTRDGADGLLVYYLADPNTAHTLTFSPGTKPVLIATTAHYGAIAEVTFELAAVRLALQRDDVIQDAVARRELQDRAADAQQRLNQRISDHLRPDAPDVRFEVLEPATRVAVGELPRARSLSPMLSVICDAVFPESPHIRNEMIGRRELSSQAAKARRLLLEAMVDHPDLEWLGLEGFGPQKAMYAALLRHTEMHFDTGDGYAFDRPHGRHAGMAAAWRTAERIIGAAGEQPVTLDVVYAALMDPPIGLKEGAIPVLLTALLLAHADDIALYQEGTYQPRITADLLERLTKSPERFSAKQFAVSGAPGKVITATADAIVEVTGRRPTVTVRSGGRRNHALLHVAGPLLTFARSLPEHTLRTHRLPPDAAAVRDALMNTREPERLLFETLPRACGVTPFSPGSRGRVDEITAYQARLTVALAALRDCYGHLLAEVTAAIAAQFRLPLNLVDLRAQLRGQAAPLTDTLLEPRLRSFVLLAVQRELDDTAWIEAVANNVTARPPASWRDEDLTRFGIELGGLAGSYGRVLSLQYEALAKGHNGFDPIRLTMTNPDGTEHASVLWVDDAARDQVETIAEQARSSVERLLGARGTEALLATLAEKVLGQRQTAKITPTTIASTAHLNPVKEADRG